MTLLVLSFVAGVLTVLAPCILPLLPIIIGKSVEDEESKIKPIIITASLAVSIILFTLVLKVSTVFISVPESVWSSISAIIIILFGLISLFPHAWEKISTRFNFLGKSNKLLASTRKNKTYLGEIMMGAALGPVFSSCSPTYFVILATVLPQSFGVGLVYLGVYAAGLSIILLLISYLGQKFVKKVEWASNPNGIFKRGLGVVFILVGIFIITGFDKKIQTFILDKGYFNSTKIEDQLLKTFNTSNNNSTSQNKNVVHYQEITNPSGFINSEPFELKTIVGKKVILLDFMTYSCINCVRTIPYINAWYDKYKDEGLEIIGIHAPEFAFERKQENVEAALKNLKIKFPVVMDNDFGTWKAYGNKYWPTKYLIDINGNIVYAHSGEGEYTEVEMKIQELLKERSQKLGEKIVEKDLVNINGIEQTEAKSPEIYFGSERNEYLGNGLYFRVGEQNFSQPKNIKLNNLYLVGRWNVIPEYAENKEKAKIIFRYTAKSVYMVASSEQGVNIQIYKDGKFYKNLSIKQDALYDLVKDEKVGEHTIEIIIEKPGLKAFTFTFG